MKLKRVYHYEMEGGPKLYHKRRKLKKVTVELVDDTKHKTAKIADKWFVELCQQLRQERIRRGISQQLLASQLGSTQTWVSELESGKLNPTIQSLQNICQELEIKFLITLNAK